MTPAEIERRINLTAIEAAAKAATQGNRAVVEHSWSDTSVYVADHRICLLSIEAEATEDTQDALEAGMVADAAFIAACDPQTVLALCAAIRAANRMMNAPAADDASDAADDLIKALEGLTL
jgi:hypothetical protein